MENIRFEIYSTSYDFSVISVHRWDLSKTGVYEYKLIFWQLQKN